VHRARLPALLDDSHLRNQPGAPHLRSGERPVRRLHQRRAVPVDSRLRRAVLQRRRGLLLPEKYRLPARSGLRGPVVRGARGRDLYVRTRSAPVHTAVLRIGVLRLGQRHLRRRRRPWRTCVVFHRLRLLERRARFTVSSAVLRSGEEPLRGLSDRSGLRRRSRPARAEVHAGRRLPLPCGQRLSCGGNVPESQSLRGLLQRELCIGRRLSEELLLRVLRDLPTPL